MKTPSSSFLSRLARFSAGLFLAALLSATSASAQVTGSVAGAVVSTATRNALQGAVVSAPSLGRSELTDNSGAFLLQGLPAGNLELTISYSGFEDRKIPVVVRAGQVTRVDAEMKPLRHYYLGDAQAVAKAAAAVAAQGKA